MHVVVIGCGRVGSELAGAPRAGRTTPSPWSTRTPAPSGACGDRLRGHDGRRLRLRPRPPRAGRDRARPARSPSVTSGDNSNILCRPHRPRDLRHRARRRPHLRPPPRADLPAARHPDRRDRRVDHRPGAAPAAARRGAAARLGRPDRQGRASSSARSRPRRSGKKLAPLNRARAASGSRRSPASARRRSSPPSVDRPGGRRARTSSSDVAALDELRDAHRAREASTDAGRDRGRGQRRALHRQRPRRRRPRGAAHRAEPRRSSTALARRRRASSGSSPTRARSRRCARPGSSAATSSSPRPATTRTTS